MLSCVNRISAETAATISGVTSGISISTLALPAQRVRARTSPNASSVPRIVATIIVTNAIWMLAWSDSRSDSFSKKRSYHWRLKPLKFWSERTELNENSATIAIGANMNTKKSAVKAGRKRGRSKSFGARLTPWPRAPRVPPTAGRAP